MITYQDWERMRSDLPGAVATVISRHRGNPATRTALDADRYDRQLNTTVSRYTRWLYTQDGRRVEDASSMAHRLASNFFNRLNTQRMAYSLGNGVTFDEDGIKERLGESFDTELRTAGYYALIHGVSFMMWNVDRVHVFPLTEFAPLWDEETGALRAGIRYWRVDPEKPVIAVLYEQDGYTRFRSSRDGASFAQIEAKRPYRVRMMQAPADAVPEVVGEENYSSVPIVPVYGSRLHQSTLVGIRAQIDAYDLIRSGYADDLAECSEIYWIVSNAGGMDDKDLANFLRRLKRNHIANVENADETSITPYTQEVPYASRQAFLADLRSGIYEDFGGLDVHAIAAGATNDHIEAAYQPLDENADDYEYQIIEAVQQLLALIGLPPATPLFKRNRISNEAERTNMVLSAATYLDDRTILEKLPFVTPDEVEGILASRDDEDMARFSAEVTPDAEVSMAPEL